MSHQAPAPAVVRGIVVVLAACTLALASAQNAAAFSFAATNLTTDTGPSAPATGDLDGDGRIDIVVANNTANSVSVFLGAGGGAFGAAANYSTAGPGTSPMKPALGDVDGDGDLDVVTSNWASNTVSLLRNAGGVLGAATSAGTTTGQPLGIALVDVDADADLDLVTANSNPGSVNVLLGDGAGAFAAAISLTQAANPRDLVVADLNGDGRPDLATADNTGNTASVWLNQGAIQANGTPYTLLPTSYAAGTAPYALAQRDLTGDGRPELVISNNTSNSVTVLLNGGSGTFTAGAPLTASLGGPTGVSASDLDGDGRADVAVANTGGAFAGDVTLFPGNGNGTFGAPSRVTVGGSPGMLTAADVSADGAADIVVAGTSASTATVLRNLLPAYVPPLALAGGGRPVVTRVTPSQGTAGTPVRVAGYGFQSVTQVYFGTTPAAGFVVHGYELLEAIAPAGVDGTVDVRPMDTATASEPARTGRFTFTPAAEPAAGAAAASGRPALTCTRVPTLVRHTLRYVRMVLRRDGCSRVPLDWSGRARRHPARVRLQSPAAGTPVHAGQRVAVIVG